MDSSEQNRKIWNKLTTLHAGSSFYNVESFKTGKTSLNHIEIEELGDLNGKKLLHLQCHFGMDTLSIARQGAEVVGVDISDTSIKKAIEFLNEFSYQVYNCFPNLTEIESGKWVSEKYGDKIPHMYSVKARKI